MKHGIYFKEAWESYGYDGVLEPGMVMCVESYVGHKAGGPVLNWKIKS